MASDSLRNKPFYQEMRVAVWSQLANEVLPKNPSTSSSSEVLEEVEPSKFESQKQLRLLGVISVKAAFRDSAHFLLAVKQLHISTGQGHFWDITTALGRYSIFIIIASLCTL